MKEEYTLLEAATLLKVSSDQVRSYVNKGSLIAKTKSSPKEKLSITTESVELLVIRYLAKERLIKANKHDGYSKSHNCICRECTLIQNCIICNKRGLTFDLVTKEPKCLEHLKDGRIGSY